MSLKLIESDMEGQVDDFLLVTTDYDPSLPFPR